MALEETAWFVAGTLLPGLLIAWVSAFAVRRVAPRVGLIDQPGARKVHRIPTPLGGGVAIWLGVVLTFVMGQGALWLVTTDASWIERLPPFVQVHVPGLAEQASRLWILLGGGTLLMVTGLVDDRWGLGWKLRLLIHFTVATVVVVWQGWHLTLFIGQRLVTWPLSIIWIVMLINSFNMLDNMDGLSAGIAAIAASMLAAVLLLVPDPASHGPQLFVGGFLLVVTGALIGFLFHNRPPAKMFMGDAGSYFVGFCIAVATLLATFASSQSSTRHAVLAPVCVMAVPLYDMCTVLFIRWREGRSPFQGDTSHFSHRLVQLGLSKPQAVLTIYLTTATCGLGALLLHRVAWHGALVIILQVLCVLALIAILEATAHRRLRSQQARAPVSERSEKE